LITTGALLALLASPVAAAQTTASVRSLAASVPVAAAAGATVNRNPSGLATIWPIEAISYELGSKRVIGYFEPRDGRCQVTLMIAEAVDPDKAPPLSATRLSLPILPGGSAGLASEEGRAIELTCGAGAQTVVVSYSSKKESGSP
jgi:hypothetical protein